MRLIDKFVSTLPQSKSQITSRLLGEESGRGQFSDVASFKTRLSEFIDHVSGSDPNPFFLARPGFVNTRIRPESFNDMLVRGVGDLEVLFREYGHMMEALEIHERIIQEQALEELRYIVGRLEEQVDLHEFLSNNNYGFSSAEWNRFTEGATPYPRNGKYGPDLYVDARTGQRIVDDLSYDPISESITLPASGRAVSIVDVELEDGMVNPWGGVVRTTTERVVARQVAGTTWVVTLSKTPISVDDDIDIFFSNGKKVLLTNSITTGLPAAAGEYLLVEDEEKKTSLAGVIDNPIVGELYFYTTFAPKTCFFDAILTAAPKGTTSFDAVLHPDGTTGVTSFDAILIGNEAKFDAVLTKDWLEQDIADITYAYVASSPDTHKEDLAADGRQNSIYNILDNTQDTFWYDVILRDEQVKGGVVSTLRLLFEGPAEVNYFEFDPATKYPFKIESLSYLTPKGSEVEIIGGLDDQILSSTRLHFSPVLAKGFVLRIRQENYEVHVYDKSEPSEITRIIEESGANSPLREHLGLNENRSFDLHKVYEYIYGLDNVSAGMLDLKDLGVHVSKGLSRSDVSLLGVNHKETKASGALTYFEMDMVKKDFDEEGAVLATTRFPVLDIGAQNTEELLVLSEDYRGRTRFRAHGTTGDSADANTRLGLCSLQVFQDGKLIPHGGRWTLLNNAAANDEEKTTHIQIDVDVANPLQVHAKYTVKYKPLYTLKGRVRDFFVDAGKRHRRRADGLVEADTYVGDRKIGTSSMWLVVTGRNALSSKKNLVTSLDEYRIAVGQKKGNRFVGD